MPVNTAHQDFPMRSDQSSKNLSRAFRDNPLVDVSVTHQLVHTGIQASDDQRCLKFNMAQASYGTAALWSYLSISCELCVLALSALTYALRCRISVLYTLAYQWSAAIALWGGNSDLYHSGNHTTGRLNTLFKVQALSHGAWSGGCCLSTQDRQHTHPWVSVTLEHSRVFVHSWSILSFKLLLNQIYSLSFSLLSNLKKTSLPPCRNQKNTDTLSSVSF